MTPPEQTRAEFQRARRTGEVEARLSSIRESARAEIASGVAPADLRMGAVAQRVDLATSSLYSYHSGRSALLLDVLADDLDHWLISVVDALADIPTGDARAVSVVIANLASRRPTLAPLLVELTANLEASVDSETLAAFKARTGEHVRAAALAIETVLPEVDGDAAMRYLRALIIGLWSFGAAPTASSGADGRSWFGHELQAATHAVLRGLGQRP